MARIAPKTREQMPADLAGLFDRMTAYGPFANLVGTLAQRAPIMRHVSGMLTELADEQLISRRHLELALVTVSRLNRCTYCVSHHAPKLMVAGLSAAGVERLLDFADHPELDAADKLVVEYAKQVTDTPWRMGDAIFERLRRHFSDAQIVELTWRIALCGAFNRFNDALQLDMEDGVRTIETSTPDRAA